jgi:hypothetical protein
LLADRWQQQEVADDGAGGWLLVSLSRVPISGLASWAVVVRFAGRRGDRHTSDRELARLLAAWFAAGAVGAAHRRRLSVLGDHEHRALGARW